MVMNDCFSLKGKTAIITGGGGGLGMGIADALGERGANIILCDLKEVLLKQAMDFVKGKGISVDGCLCDVTKPETFSEVLALAEKSFGGIDILINNAGVTLLQNPLEVSAKDWDFIFDINVKGLFLCTQLFSKKLIAKKKPGYIVNVASNGAKVTYDTQVHYCASKASIVNMTQCLASAFAKYNINVNAVCPGAVDTEMLKECMVVTEKESGGKITVEDCRKNWGPPQIGRLIQPVEVGRIIAFLCTDAAAVIRGQSINVDAGFTKF
jgi:meso-butanediol dehydrogenase/(S,S)-butanediol dehydrogenase/diacetyl reductase